ncbi:MAG: hypothetical protein RLZZ455_687 [Candidatus Parcubacteria bacterium]|jgi:membrane-bound metal-dependent hydrolase YbcI (DUF457 family)
MDLILDIIAHFVFSVCAGLFAWKIYGTKSMKSMWVAVGAAMVSGVLIDIDHLFDYMLFYGWNFNLYYFLYGQQFVMTKKNYVLFHGFEYVAILGLCMYWAKTRVAKMVFLSLLVSLIFHLFIDMMIYSIPVRHYFLIFRALTGFVVSH